MLINEPAKSLERIKEIKVKIPIAHHVRLHSMKVLTGKQISDAVAEALELYFQATNEGNSSLSEDPRTDLALGLAHVGARDAPSHERAPDAAG